MQKRKFTTREISYLAMVTATCVVGRFAFQWIPNFQPMTAIFLLFTRYFGFWRGMIVNVLALVITNFYFGMGIWTIEQILSFGIVLLLFRICCFSSIFRSWLPLQIIVSIFAGFCYGFSISLMDSYVYGLPNFWVYYAQGVSFDFLHAVGNGIFYTILSPVFHYLMKVKASKDKYYS